MKSRRYVLLVALAWIPVSSAIADTIHVPGDFPTIQEAIEAALDGDEIVVARGTYPEAIDFLGKAVELRSSDGAEVTIIDATDLDTSVVTFASGEERDSVIDGFTITGGTGTEFGEFGTEYGGGVFIQEGSPIVRNLVLGGNAAKVGGGLASIGGGHPLVLNGRFIENHAYSGGGGLYSRDGDLTVRGSTFIGNEGRLGGGGMYAAGGFVEISDVTFRENSTEHAWGGGLGVSRLSEGSTISRCLFEDNWAYRSGAGFLHASNPGDVAHVIDCTFRGNESRDTGGGAQNYYGGDLVLTRCTFERNYAHFNGGAIGGDQGSVTVIDSTFHGNTARVNGGAIYTTRRADSVVMGSVFVGNVSRYWGGAVFNATGSHETINSTFVDNFAPISGGGLYARNSSSMVFNSIVRGESPQPISQDISDLIVGFSNVEGGWEGEGNIDVDPMFARDPHPGDDGEWGTGDDDYGDLRMLAGSAGIDAANNHVVPPSVMLDLAGMARFVDDPAKQDAGEGRCPVIDMGAFEFQEEGGCCPGAVRWICDGDVDGDAQVNPVDAGLVQGAFGSGEEADLCRFDIDCDGQINPVDSGIVQSLFGTCEPPRDVCP